MQQQFAYPNVYVNVNNYSESAISSLIQGFATLFIRDLTLTFYGIMEWKGYNILHDRLIHRSSSRCSTIQLARAIRHAYGWRKSDARAIPTATRLPIDGAATAAARLSPSDASMANHSSGTSLSRIDQQRQGNNSQNSATSACSNSQIFFFFAQQTFFFQKETFTPPSVATCYAYANSPDENFPNGLPIHQNIYMNQDQEIDQNEHVGANVDEQLDENFAMQTPKAEPKRKRKRKQPLEQADKV